MSRNKLILIITIMSNQHLETKTACWYLDIKVGNVLSLNSLEAQAEEYPKPQMVEFFSTYRC